MKRYAPGLEPASSFDVPWTTAEGPAAPAPLGNGDDSMVGTDGDDVLWAGAGNDTIDGLGGNDTIEAGGGIGDDVYLFGKDSGHDTITRANTYADEVNTLKFKPGVKPSDVSFAREWRTYVDDDGNWQSEYVDLRITLSSGATVLIQDFSRGDNPFAKGNPLSAISFDDGTTWDLSTICSKMTQGTAGDDLLVGFVATPETLRGLGGNDTLAGNAGDTLLGGAGDDELSGDAVRLDGGTGNDYLQGVDGAILLGGDGDDTLYGGTNQQGGSGNDVLSGDVATLDGGAGQDRLIGSDRSTLVGGEGNDELSVSVLGSASQHTSMQGGAGNDTLQGGLYTDVRFGRGDGRDAYIGFSNADGTATQADRATLQLASGIAVSDFGITLAGNDLQLGFGAGDGIDLVDYFADAGSIKRGPDAVISIGTVAFASGQTLDVRDLLIDGTNASDTMAGTGGNDLLAGYVGNDKLDGGAGHDGLHGGYGDDSLTGGDGHDTLVGYTGRDTLVGGLGDDVYYLDDWDVAVSEAAGAGSDTVVYAPVKYTPVIEYTLRDNFENLTLQEGGAALVGNGNGLANRLTGNQLDNGLNGLAGADTLLAGAGNDTLDGGLGIDSMQGGAGDDFFVVDDAGDLTLELAGEGIDSVLVGMNWKLASNIENLQLTGSTAAKGTGNSLANALAGNEGANTLLGMDGRDTLDGALGNDRLEGGKGGDTYLIGRGGGKDTVVENDATAGVRDTADFGDLTRGEVKFVHVGDNLEARIIGTQDKFIFKGWYLGTEHQVEDFVFADGAWTGDQVAPALADWAWNAHSMTPGLIDTRMHDVLL